MAKRKLTQERVDEIHAAYDDWSQWASTETSLQFAERMGISKARLYDLRKRNWRLSSSRTPRGDSLEELDNAAAGEAISPGLLNRLLDQLVAEKVRVQMLEAELEECRNELADCMKQLAG